MFKNIIKYFQRHNAYRKTYQELSKLSTKELRDIGIERSMITRIALESAYGEDYLNV
jgi:uncharacterized protein YjiS (DUF1127 family)